MSRATQLRFVLVALMVGVAGVAVAGDEKAGDAKGEARKAEARKAAKSAEEPPTPEEVSAGKVAFLEVAKVLQHPRCMNCHPSGDAPLQTDASLPHKMNVSRASEEAGLKCATCHQGQNSEALGIPGGPPGAPNWHLPPKDTPMVFQGHTPASLCAQLADPAQNGGKDLAALLEHVSHDRLVLWGWNPGGDRTKPPMPHNEFVALFKLWVDGGGACPE